MFVDEVEIEVLAGNGGNGMATFRREKYVPRGGPNGGDGGHGGSVVFVVDPNITTLLDYRYKHKYKAGRGGDGGSKDMFGRDGEDLILKVPIGTVIVDIDSGQQIADLSAPDSRAVTAKGGVGGRGNAHFATSIHQAPMFSENGEPGEQRRLRLELKLLADVGLLGFPNAGKSTLISACSAARPKIANYPFTTLTPNLGVVAVGPDRSFVMADIPGIIEGASEGVGLGHQFLKHVERCRLLVHMLDVSGLSGREPMEDFDIMNEELRKFNPLLAETPQLVALNKIDVADPEFVSEIAAALDARGIKVHLISAATQKGVQPLLYALINGLDAARAAALPTPAEAEVRISAKVEEDDRHWEARQVEPHIFEVVGKGIERMVAMTDLTNEQGLRRLQRSLEKIGINRKLKAAGAEDGDTVRIRGIEFEYQDEGRSDQETEEDSRAGRREARR